MGFRFGGAVQLAAGLGMVVAVVIGCGGSTNDRPARSDVEPSRPAGARRIEARRETWRNELAAQVQAGQARAAYATWEAASPSFKVAEPRLGARVMEARAHECLSMKAYDCVVDSVELARYLDASRPSRELQAAVARELRAEARKLERQVGRAQGPDRAASAAAAASVWAMWSTVTRKPWPRTARRLATIVALDEAEAERRRAEEGRTAARERGPAPARSPRLH